MNMILLIFGMAVGTYLTRCTPVLLLGKIHYGKKFEKFLSLIPFSAMAALIFPDVLQVDADHMIIGIAGALTAVILSWCKASLTIVVIGAVLVCLSLGTVLGG